LGERLLCKQEVIGSIPFTSTSWHVDQLGEGRVAVSRWELGKKTSFAKRLVRLCGFVD
jgi:hypothetical protein